MSNKNKKTDKKQREDESLKNEKKDKYINKNIDEIETTKDELKVDDQIEKKSENYETEISKLREEKLRLLAEMENLRKRFEREKSESIKFGSSKLARDILSPNDNLIRALKNIPEDKKISEPINNFINGLKMVQKEFTAILEKHGINQINALNKKFDHNLHQAMLEIETDEEEGIVVQELQSGYTMHERLLRPSMVGVSKKTQKNEEKK
jgi:molecular chaperone GrpE